MHIPTYVNSAAPKYRTRLRSREPDLHSRGIRNHGRMALAEDGGHLRDCPGGQPGDLRTRYAIPLALPPYFCLFLTVRLTYGWPEKKSL